jgi:Ca2+-transporting ATPase
MSTSRRSLPASSKRPSLAQMHANSIELSTLPEPSIVSTSAHSMLHPMSPAGHPAPDHPPPPSPPASSYFPTFADTQFGEPQPTPGATSHFAYSTTLRRHHAEPMGLIPQRLPHIAPGVTAEGWLQKALGAVTGQRSKDDALESGYSLVNDHSTPLRTNREEKPDTPSARFAHWSVEVCHGFFFLHPGGFPRRDTWPY